MVKNDLVRALSVKVPEVDSSVQDNCSLIPLPHSHNGITLLPPVMTTDASTVGQRFGQI